VSEATILVVDDEKNIRRTLALVLEGEGFVVVDAGTAEEALELLERRRVDMALFDVCLPGMDGITALKLLHEQEPELPVVMISGHASVRDAVEATRSGAFDFIEKPLSRERVLVTVRNALQARSRAREIQTLKETVPRAPSGMLGHSPALQRLREQITKVAPTRARVLITGESGTGKELVARAIHDASERAGRPFIKFNCAAIPNELIESTLFGHEKGAFTHAMARRRGGFELADTGTLFLDEVGDMSLTAQAKVLRVLQTGELSRVGSETSIQVDVRVIAATNKDLEQACRDGSFREDLYFRLNVVPLHSPPLRTRRGDIPLLAQHFLEQVCAENGFRSKRFEPETLVRLQALEFPGNVRELRNLVERMAILSGERITPDDLPSEGPRRVSEAPSEAWSTTLFEHGSLRDFREAAERAFITARLAAHDWNISRAAESLDLERTNLHKKLKALGIHRE